MKVLIDKPKNIIERSLGSFQSTNTTYADPTVTYNSSTQVYSGFYGQADIGPENVMYFSYKPSMLSLITGIGDVTPAIPGASVGQPYGLLLSLTQP